MGNEIYVKVIPGCPTKVVCDDEEERAVVEEALANMDCGCVVEVEAAAEELAEAAIEEAAAEVAEEAAAELGLTCSLEPDKPWEESVCGVVAREAGRQAAEDVMSRIRPIIQRMKVSEGGEE
ncbi:hypothetical protein ES703_84821 [subsurface metagenome]